MLPKHNLRGTRYVVYGYEHTNAYDGEWDQLYRSPKITDCRNYIKRNQANSVWNKLVIELYDYNKNEFRPFKEEYVIYKGYKEFEMLFK